MKFLISKYSNSSLFFSCSSHSQVFEVYIHVGLNQILISASLNLWY
jgi:hypothetical protein